MDASERDDPRHFSTANGGIWSRPPSSDPQSIQRILHFSNQPTDQQASPARTTPAKRVASRSPPRIPTTPSRPAVASPPLRPSTSEHVAGPTFPPTTAATPRRSSRSRRDSFSPMTPHNTQRHPSTQTPLRRSPRQPAAAPVRPPVKQGRPPGEMWEHFHATKVGGKKVAVCKYCDKSHNDPKTGGNMATHVLRHCKKIPPSVKDALIQSTCQVEKSIPPTGARTGTGAALMHDPALKPTARPIDQAAFNLLLVELVVVCALPFSILDATVFKEFIEKLAPGIKTPPRQYLTQSLLQEVANSMRQRVIAKINEYQYVSIVTDGWTDPNGAKIVNFMVVAPGMPSMFWSSWASGSTAHTAENIAARVEQVIAEIQCLTSARVVGIVTDNASNMTSMW